MLSYILKKISFYWTCKCFRTFWRKQAFIMDLQILSSIWKEISFLSWLCKDFQKFWGENEAGGKFKGKGNSKKKPFFRAMLTDQCLAWIIPSFLHLLPLLKRNDSANISACFPFFTFFGSRLISLPNQANRTTMEKNLERDQCCHWHKCWIAWGQIHDFKAKWIVWSWKTWVSVPATPPQKISVHCIQMLLRCRAPDCN